MPAATYNALSGSEVKTAILAQLEKLMEQDDRFHQAVTYPIIRWTFSLDVEAYPADSGMFVVEHQGLLINQNPAVETVLKETVDVDGANTLPDHVREQTGQPVLRPTVTASGI